MQIITSSSTVGRHFTVLDSSSRCSGLDQRLISFKPNYFNTENHSDSCTEDLVRLDSLRYEIIIDLKEIDNSLVLFDFLLVI